MHELSIALRILDIATAALPPELPEARVEAINLEIGRLTAVVPESLRFCFEIVTRGTPFDGAALNMEEIAVVVVCRDCGAESEQQDFPFVCDRCQCRSVDLICGRELLVSSIEVADPVPGTPAGAPREEPR